MRGLKHPLHARRWKGIPVAPLWVRGLKLFFRLIEAIVSLVAPLWVRGLKPETLNEADMIENVAPLWVRGLKHQASGSFLCEYSRTLVGAWIETCIRPPLTCKPLSHPCGCVD